MEFKNSETVEVSPNSKEWHPAEYIGKYGVHDVCYVYGIGLVMWQCRKAFDEVAFAEKWAEEKDVHIGKNKPTLNGQVNKM